jgi:RNA polymerase sigma-70 factor, ECF subfamily
VTLEKQNQVFLEWAGTYDSLLWKIARLHAPFGEHEELHQDLLIALWKAAPLYREQAKPSTFIYRLALNRAMNWTRDRRGYWRRHVPLEETPARVSTGDREERVEALYKALGALPQADRSLALLYLEDLGYREIADILGITENNVGVKLNRLKKRLTELLQLEPIESGDRSK